MSDIVERLEHYAKMVMPNYPDDLCSEAAAEIRRLRAAAQSAPDEDYPDCATPREREMYAALMLLTSALAERRTEWRNWKQGGGMIEPIVMKALRLDLCSLASLSSTQRNEDQP